MEREIVFIGENNQALTNSLLVAEKFGKEHRHILDSIRNLVAENSAASLLFAESQYENRGKMYPMYIMNRDGFTLLVMGFTGKDALQFKLDYINAFNQMEQTIKYGGFQVPTTFKEALLLAAHQQEQIEVQQKQIELMKPKEEFFDTVTGSKDACDMATTAKVLNMGVGRNTLFEILRDNKILQGNNQPMQRYVDAGWFRVVETQFTKKSGDICINFKTIVYQKGIDGIRKVVLTHLNKRDNEDRN